MGILSQFSNMKLAFGGASISGSGAGYGFGDISLKNSVYLLKHAYEEGIRIFDSAPIYGFGESEKRIGKALNDVRENVFFISKSGVTWDHSKRVNMTNSPKVAEKMFDQTLKNFNCDYIDLYMVHWPDQNTDLRFVLEFYQNLKEKGKIKHIGLCNTSIEEIEKSKEVCLVEVIQSEYNLFNQAHFDGVIKNNLDLDFMGWGTFDKGILSERVSRKRELSKNYDLFDCRKKAPWWNQKVVLKKIERVRSFIDKSSMDMSMAEFSFLFSFQSNIIPLVGSKTIKDLNLILKWSKENKDISRLLEIWNA